MNRLDGKIAIVTGGAGGIGKETAKLFLSEGASVVLVDLDESALKESAAELGSDKVSYTAADVSVDHEVSDAIASASEVHGQIDIIFANAGIEGAITPIVDYPMEVFDKLISVNVRGVFSTLRHGIPVMAASGGGSIIITSSIAGLRGFAGLSAYVTSKHAVVGLMRSAVLECADNGVRVNTVHPSPINTRMMRAIENGAAPGDPASAVESFEAQIPMGRYGEPGEVGDAVVFLASDESRFISGATLTVDGGMSVG